MSDSDDTDILLLIPPDFFIVPSDQELDEIGLVSELITQVNDLESRVSVIESLENVTTELKWESDSVSLESKMDNEFQPLNSSFTDSTIESKKQWSPSKRLDLPEVDRLLKEMETTQAQIENKLRQREMEFGGKPHKPEVQKRITQLGDDLGSVPDLGFGIRNLFGQSSSPAKEDHRKPVVEEPCVKKNMSLLGRDDEDTSGPRWKSYLSHGYTSPNSKSIGLSPEKRRQRPLRRRLILNSDGLPTSTSLEHDMHFGLNDKPEENTEKSKPTEMAGSGEGRTFSPLKSQKNPSRQPQDREPPVKPPYTIGSNGERLISLNKLWREDNVADNTLSLQEKLEEEKYRRKHLEQTIQSLQRKVLEEQEKIAVAVQVDEAKDKAIGQVTDAWRQMVNHWKTLEEQRHEVSQKLLLEKAASKRLHEDMNKKVERWEREVSQALDLAAGYKGKCEGLETELFTTQETMSARIVELEEISRRAKEKASRLEEERKDLAERLQISQDEHEKEKRLVAEARKDLAMAEEALSQNEAELAVVKEQRDLLSQRLREERARGTTLEQHKTALQSSLDDALEKLRKAEEESKTAAGQLEGVRAEVRGVYQAQLESVVREKLVEFQTQLDTAQQAMQMELQAAQRHQQENNMRQQQALVNSHVTEMRRLETLHKEEMRSLEERLSEAQKRCSRLESGKKDIAQKLHSVMEHQWQQALSIITSELSIRQPEGGEETSKKKDVDKKEALFQQWTEEAERRNKEMRNRHQDNIQSPRSCDDAPFNRDDQLTYRLSTVGAPPASTQPNQDQLFKYIQMLLDRQPGNPVDSLASSGILQDMTLSSDILEEPNLEHPKWNELINKNLGSKETEQRGLNLRSKPPWKPT